MKATTFVRWLVALILLTLAIQSLPLRSTSADDPYPSPSSQPSSEAYPAPLSIPPAWYWDAIYPPPASTPPAWYWDAIYPPPESDLGPVAGQVIPTGTPIRDLEWEAEFQVVHDRQPESQDVADRQWSLNFLGQSGRAPTQAEWEGHYFEER